MGGNLFNKAFLLRCCCCCCCFFFQQQQQQRTASLRKKEVGWLKKQHRVTFNDYFVFNQSQPQWSGWLWIDKLQLQKKKTISFGCVVVLIQKKGEFCSHHFIPLRYSWSLFISKTVGHSLTFLVLIQPSVLRNRVVCSMESKMPSGFNSFVFFFRTKSNSLVWSGANRFALVGERRSRVAPVLALLLPFH